MDPHERLAQVALQAGVRHGFRLAGGYAVQEHGFVNRLSKDVDLLTAEASVVDFPASPLCTDPRSLTVWSPAGACPVAAASASRSP